MPLPPSLRIKHDWDAVGQVYNDLNGISALQEEVDWRVGITSGVFSRLIPALAAGEVIFATNAGYNEVSVQGNNVTAM
jgi:hypothetical protein